MCKVTGWGAARWTSTQVVRPQPPTPRWLCSSVWASDEGKQSPALRLRRTRHLHGGRRSQTNAAEPAPGAEMAPGMQALLAGEHRSPLLCRVWQGEASEKGPTRQTPSCLSERLCSRPYSPPASQRRSHTRTWAEVWFHFVSANLSTPMEDRNLKQVR